MTSPQSSPPRLFFLHILKTGGTSFYRFLENNYSRDESIRDDTFAQLHQLKDDPAAFATYLQQVRLITKLHLDFSFVEQQRALDPTLRVVTLLRQPVRRCFSMIEHWRRVPEVHIASLDAVRRQLVLDARTMPAAAFVEKHQQRLSDHQTKILGGVSDHVSNPPRETLLPTALANLASVDFVGLTEQISDTATYLAAAMGFYNSMNPQPLNMTRDDRRLTSAEKQEIEPVLTDLNRCDAALYAAGELRFSQTRNRWKQQQFQAASPERAVPLALGETFHFSMEEPLRGDGWHEREGGVEQSCRWAGPERQSSLWLACCPQGRLDVTITLLSVISDEILSGMHLTIAGQTVAHKISQEGQRLLLRATVECCGPSTDWLELTFSFAGTRSAFDIAGLDDLRQKTVAVAAVDIHRTG